MDNQFRKFLDLYLVAWRSSSLDRMRDLISTDYKAREIKDGDIFDFGFEESINGWEQGFLFAQENNAEWALNEVAIIPLRTDEIMVIISATMILKGKCIDSAHLFFQTFRKENFEGWKIVRSYIEAGISLENIRNIQFT
ncbi:flavoprotein [Sutcliffiella horikoshii]|uniref:Flavoprotein n=1 Tax=Sutcliffiella horikoshii TaxID=79883 RepID=A0A5D4TJP3_9BACI|nr:flavoprotein [Sutcliffiella horikoshii]TYS74296.1 flavoprotein [Sutcliffiella horikoshii]